MRSVILLLALCSACATPSTGEGDDDDSSTAASFFQETRWYIGESQTSLPNGTELGPPSPVVLKRTLDEEAGTIQELIAQLDENGDVSEFDITQAVDLEAGTFSGSFADDYGTFDVLGTLEGDAWAWDAWGSRSTYEDGPHVGSYVLSADTRTDDEIHAVKDAWSPDDDHEVHIDEVLGRVDESEYEEARAAM